MRKYHYVIPILLVVAAMLIVLPQALGQEAPGSGTWTGLASFNAGGAPATAEVRFDVTDGAVSAGQIKLQFQYAGMSQGLLDLMLAHGCVVSFAEISPTSLPVAGQFASSTQAAGTFNASSCYLQDYGDLQFVNPIMGTWTASLGSGDSAVAIMPTSDGNASSDVVDTSDTTDSSDAAASILPAATSGPFVGLTAADYQYLYQIPQPDHPNADMTGRQLYKLHCEECHGVVGEGTGDAPALANEQSDIIIARNVRVGPENMEPLTVDILPDDQVDKLIDFTLRLYREVRNPPRTGYTVTIREVATIVPFEIAEANAAGAPPPDTTAADASTPPPPTAVAVDDASTPPPPSADDSGATVTPTPTITPTPTATPRGSGRQMYEQFCGECHGNRGEGTEQGMGLLDQEWSDLHFINHAREGIEGTMDPITEEALTDNEIRDILTFVMRLQQR